MRMCSTPAGRSILDDTFADSMELPANDDEVRILDIEYPTPSDAPSFASDELKRKRGRSSTSYVWKFYEKVGMKDGKEKCSCKGCGKLFGCASSSGTSHLIRHADKCKKFDKFHDRSQMLNEAGIRAKTRRLHQKMVGRTIAKAIVMHDLPYRFFEYSKIRELMRILNPDVKFSKHSIVEEINNLYLDEKLKLKNILADVTSRICITSDVWNLVNGTRYICLTAHFVDIDWNLKSKILNFCAFPPPYTGQNLVNMVMKFLRDWEIEKKIFSITLDNASTNNSMVTNLKEQLKVNNVLLFNGEYFHVRCSAHILDLIVQECLEAVSEALLEIRASVGYVKSSEVRMRQFKECVSKCYNIDAALSLCTDVCARWNSTYLMLVSALKFRQAFDLYSTMDSHYINCPSHAQWERVKKICEFLETLYEITNLMSESIYPTSNIFFLLVVKMEMLLTQNLSCNDGVMVDMAFKIKGKFDKYWREYSVLLAFGTILDPRCKLDGLEYLFCQVDSTSSKDRVSNIEKELRRLFEEYSCNIRASSQPNLGSTQQATSNSAKVGGIANSSLNLFRIILSKPRSAPKSELDLYLAEPIMVCDEYEDLDILQYWRLHSIRFPTLSRMAADLLSVPITTAASESAFSIGSHVLAKFRSVELPDHVQSIICTRNWLKGYKVEDEQSMIEENSFTQSTSLVASNAFVEDDD